ncbi:uncharacterized protein MONOS_15528 [Monocercomonoides exilis]|uniref:uncharacterized protein n=1 Tax=Monocercomonoides exilis TaxID=2049356 RepID=UPI00355A12E0|nr:hypothetical protein MONOS_15528 [Monocercomonoides exilis]|eukprot:MONOS_15528.1-p1 / transcript=MONOS_15528.1 / gene=MONOS_15528 / organism=Monocercomonoides_exilis_PA203 / gene_product=unspecified product / transcript_product=unspecified product / location=Mono_scaffold01263:10380-14060(+) / protein_length=1226 / sequence_SO=supercontig / SO=protein_coding / is_pseudo=false
MRAVNFSMNSAKEGNDFFIYCNNINEQVTNSLFSLDYSQSSFSDDKAFCGIDISQEVINILSLIRFYRSEQIFVTSSDSLDNNTCGSVKSPCQTVSEGVKHIDEGYARFLWILDEAEVGGEAVMDDLTVRSRLKENCRIILSKEYASTSADSSLIQTADDVVITLCDFAFGSAFQSKHVSVLNQINGTTSITQCSFTGEDETVAIHSALFSVQKGRLDILKTSISLLTVGGSLIRTEQEGNALLSNSTVSNINANNGILDGKQGNASLERVNITNCNSNFSIFAFSSQSCGSLLKVKISTIEIKDGAVILINADKNPDDISSHSSFSALQLPNEEAINHALTINTLTVEHVKRTTNGACVISASGESTLLSSSSSLSSPYSSLSASNPFTLQFTNCSFIDCYSPSTKGSIASFFSCPDIQLHDCLFDGSTVSAAATTTSNNKNAKVNDDKRKRISNAKLDDPEICTWQGSLLHLEQSNAVIEIATFANSAKGGLSITKSNATLSKSDFEGNKPNIPGFESVNRNIHCVGQESMLTVENVDGSGDESDAATSSLWILNEGCKLSGAAADRQSPFFIPSLKRATNRTVGDNREIAVSGSLLIPCDLSFRIIYDHSSSSEIVNHEFSSFVSEAEAIATVPEAEIAEKGDKSVMSVQLVFNEKNGGNPSYSTILMLQNTTVADSPDDGRISQVNNGGNSTWMIAFIIAIVLVLILLILIIVQIAWKKRKGNKAENQMMYLKEIEMENEDMMDNPLNGTRKAMNKMGTMDLRCADGTTSEILLGNSSDSYNSKDALLPNMSSTVEIAGLDTIDVATLKREGMDGRGGGGRWRSGDETTSTATSELDSFSSCASDMAPTTSSISNLIEGMSCETPFEKIIVDLRDSLFVHVHQPSQIPTHDGDPRPTKAFSYPSSSDARTESGKSGQDGKDSQQANNTALLATRKEQYASQVLFWALNGCQHLMEIDPKNAILANLSPHCILFGDEGVIVLGVELDDELTLGGGSRSRKGVSTATTTIGNRNGNERGGGASTKTGNLGTNTSSYDVLFTDDSLRWKAPELVKETSEANEKTLAFSVGMMLWEISTENVPFEDVDALTAAMKLASYELPALSEVFGEEMRKIIKQCLSRSQQERPSLIELKRMLISQFPEGMTAMTMSDAIDLDTTASERLMSDVEESEEEQNKSGYDDEEEEDNESYASESVAESIRTEKEEDDSASLKSGDSMFSSLKDEE